MEDLATQCIKHFTLVYKILHQTIMRQGILAVRNWEFLDLCLQLFLMFLRLMN